MTPDHVPEDWQLPNNMPRTGSVIFVDPTEYPPTPISDRYRGALCSFGDGEKATYIVLGTTGPGRPPKSGTAVCDGHLEAVNQRDVTWI